MRPLLFGSGKVVDHDWRFAESNGASMRPLLFGSGKFDPITEHVHAEGASMRPLLFGSGKAARDAAKGKKTMLQ